MRRSVQGLYPRLIPLKLKSWILRNLKKLPNKMAQSKKEQLHIIVELIEYEQNAVVSKSIMKKTTGSINALSFASG
jgi:hypothetical protein